MAEVKKGVIAAAGLNTRFLPISKGVTKGLIPVLEKPSIQYLVEEMISANIDQIAIIHNHGDPSIKRYFTPDIKLQKLLKQKGKQDMLGSLENIWQKTKLLKFYPQPKKRLPYGNATPILVAKSFIGNDPFVYMFGDDLVVEDQPGAYLAHLIKVFEKYLPSLVIGVQEVDQKEVSRYGIVKYLENQKVPNQVAGVIEKPSFNNSPSRMAQFGRFIVSPKIFEVLSTLKIRRGELWFADAANILSQKGIVIAKPIQNGTWLTTGDPLRWLKTNLAFAFKNENFKKEIKSFLKENSQNEEEKKK